MSEERGPGHERQLLAWGLGLLSDEESQPVRDWWEELQRSVGGPAPARSLDRHVPASLLARWPQVEPRLSGLERELVLRHLERCDACQVDLGVLAEIRRPVAAAGPAAVAPGAVAARRPRRATSAARWVPWFGGAAVGAALAAGVLLVVGRPSGTQLQQSPGTGGPLTWVALSFARGSPSSLQGPPPGQPFVLAVAVPMDFPEGEPVLLAVQDPSGMEVARFAIAPTQILSGTALVQLRPREQDGSWPVGSYRVQLRSGDRLASGEFVLRPSSAATKPAQQ